MVGVLIPKGKRAKARKFLKQFESTINMAELRALSKQSLRQPLSDAQFKRVRRLRKLEGI